MLATPLDSLHFVRPYATPAIERLASEQYAFPFNSVARGVTLVSPRIFATLDAILFLKSGSMMVEKE